MEVAMTEVFKGILCIIGVGIIAGIVFFFYKKMLEFIGGALVIGLGILADHLIYKVGIPWPFAILGCGVVAGLLCIPYFLVQEIDALNETVAKLSPRESPND
jgi:hypothetical protein